MRVEKSNPEKFNTITGLGKYMVFFKMNEQKLLSNPQALVSGCWMYLLWAAILSGARYFLKVSLCPLIPWWNLFVLFHLKLYLSAEGGGYATTQEKG